MRFPLLTHAPFILCAAILSAGPGWCADWPAYRHDAARSGVAGETLRPPLHELWMFKPRQAPAPAWPEPAPRDYWHRIRELKPTVTYDRAFHTVAANGRVYCASSADDRVLCLDAATGAILWTYFTEGPVRLAPALWEDRVYVGSDDGWVYCLSAGEGTLQWRHRPSEAGRRIPGNGRLVSPYPVRAGVVVDQGVLYYCAGLFPPDDVYAVALDAKKGKELWVKPLESVSPQGYMVASSTNLFVPAGRTDPAVLDRKDGAFLKRLTGGGGSFAVLAGDFVAAGIGRTTGNTLYLSEADAKDSIATCEGVRMVVDGNRAFVHTQQALRALDREKYLLLSRERRLWEKKNEVATKKTREIRDSGGSNKAEALAALKAESEACAAEMKRLDAERDACYLWTTENEPPYEMILAGDTLYAGGDGLVTAFDKETGRNLWMSQVDGHAYGLSVADGHLLVSTDSGAIHCFGLERQPNRNVLVEQSPGWPEITEPYRNAARRILEKAGCAKGYAVVLDSGTGELAAALAQGSELQVIGLEHDAKKVAAARAALSGAGLYGRRVTLMEWDGKSMPLTPYVANLVTRDAGLEAKKMTAAPEEIKRVLRPDGGTAVLLAEHWNAAMDTSDGSSQTVTDGWVTLRRGPVPGAGEWTQLYANSQHTASSTDTLEGPVVAQWFGEPGPQRIIDRHHRPMSPLFKDGRLFVMGDEVIYAVDAYNGTPLWTLEVPGSRRIGAMKNSGQAVLTADLMYVANKNACLRVNVADGVCGAPIPTPAFNGQPRDWGYLDVAGEMLVGSTQRQGASFDKLSDLTCDMLEGDNRLVMISESLFALDRHSAAPAWTYARGAILNSGIAIDNGHVFFLESRNAKAVQDQDGRIELRDFFAGESYAVSLDVATGKTLWERPLALPFQHIAFVNTADGVVVCSGTYNEQREVYYGFFALDAATGNDLWKNQFRALDIRAKNFADPEGSHGEQWQHPVLIGGTMYARPFAFDLRTGAQKDYIARRGGHGCGGLTGSLNYLYGRGDNPRMYPLDTKETEGVCVSQASRPGCWLNMVPAGGLLLIPESSSGCTCAYAIQSSFAFIPRAVAQTVR